jgi:hypothetical protein
MKATGIAISADTLFDVQIKRIHEYKRQLLNVLHVITRYNRDPRRARQGMGAAHGDLRRQVGVGVFHGEADHQADQRRRGGRQRRSRRRRQLKVVFVPNYGVSVAKMIIPAADLSEQISTAGSEASGTGNMKLALNGALTIGTEDGANIEIRDAVGAENMFVFGLDAAEVRMMRDEGYQPRVLYEKNPALKQVLDQIGSGRFSPDEPGRFQPIVQALLDHGDHYMLLADYAAYVEAQGRVDALFTDADAWTRKAIRNVAAMARSRATVRSASTPDGSGASSRITFLTRSRASERRHRRACRGAARRSVLRCSECTIPARPVRPRAAPACRQVQVIEASTGRALATLEAGRSGRPLRRPVPRRKNRSPTDCARRGAARRSISKTRIAFPGAGRARRVAARRRAPRASARKARPASGDDRRRVRNVVRAVGAERAARVAGRRFQPLGRAPAPDAPAPRMRRMGDLPAGGGRWARATSSRCSTPKATRCR